MLVALEEILKEKQSLWHYSVLSLIRYPYVYNSDLVSNTKEQIMELAKGLSILYTPIHSHIVWLIQAK